jgi:hypothetical protein
MSYIESSLSADERIEKIFRLHWVNKIPMFLWAIITPFTFGISLIPLAYEWFRLRGLEQGLTNRRVICKSGIISRGTEEMQLRAIEHVGIDQGILGRIFDFGTITVAGRGMGKVKIATIADPTSAKKKIESLIFQ